MRARNQVDTRIQVSPVDRGGPPILGGSFAVTGSGIWSACPKGAFKKFSLGRRTWVYGSMIASQSKSLTTTFVKDFLPGYVMTHQMANVLGLELPVHNHSTAAKIGIGQVEAIWGCCQMETHRVGLSGCSCTATSYAL